MREWFGPPQEKTFNLSGEVLWIWHFVRVQDQKDLHKNRQRIPVRIDGDKVQDVAVGGPDTAARLPTE